jgi:ParB-like chromosome segregation protein Spo0J
MTHITENRAWRGGARQGCSFEQNAAEQNRPTSATQALKFHPLADLFPPMEGQDFDDLVADIKANGLHEPIVTYEGMILDGRNRYRACIKAGIEPKLIKGDDWIDDPAAYVISANIHRRHLTAEQKRELVEKLLKAAPEKSDRQIAKIAKVSPTTVGTKRAKMENAGDVSKLDTRRDTRGRKQPSKKKVAEGKKPKPSQRELEAKQAHINEPKAAREHDNDLAAQLQAAKIKIAGLESEVEELKAENAELRAKLEAARASS